MYTYIYIYIYRYIYIYIYIYIYTCMCIYIYRERERDREIYKDSGGLRAQRAIFAWAKGPSEAGARPALGRLHLGVSLWELASGS